ncbi:hypothetical protein [Microbacterium halotolerans]|uniref:hypothetical protein n=1 Tax=Microbacterium halotolerans TaxID=246613 RepID=UPI000E6AE1EC|nr:hypothetical protein [Microbacterium halotolerans]
MTTPQQPNQPPHSPQGQPQQPYPQQYSAPLQASGYPMQTPQARPSSGGKGLAWTAIVLAASTVLVSPFITLGNVLAQGGDPNAVARMTLLGALAVWLPLLFSLLGGVLAGIALRGPSKALAGAGLGANALVLLSVLVGSLLMPALFGVLL